MLNECSAIVLAGGRSSRMGTPKALLPFGGEPLIVHIVSALQRLFSDVVVVAAPDQDLPDMPVTLVRDEVPFQGPVGGIFYGLRAAAHDVAFVTSCDSAFLNPRLIAHLVSQISEHDVVVPAWQGRLQPLHAVYRCDVAPLLEAQLARGELRPVHLFGRVRTRQVDAEEVRRCDPEGWSFFNMNTPDDYATALQRWNDVMRADPMRRRDRSPDGSVPCVVELFGVARLIAQTSEVPLVLPPPATCAQAFAALADKLPVLVGRVIDPSRRRLAEGYSCNVNGLEFVRFAANTTISPRDRIVILSADAGG